MLQVQKIIARVPHLSVLLSLSLSVQFFRCTTLVFKSKKLCESEIGISTNLLKMKREFPEGGD